MELLDFWTILVGILAGISCSLVGCFLVLRRMSLLGDAISHAVLPGIALGFLLSGKVTGPGIILGAMAMGMVTAFLTQTLSRAVNVAEDASLGVVFTTLFALGVVLISMHGSHAKNVDLDAGCVLYGLIEMVALDTVPLFGYDIPNAVITLAVTLAIVLGCILLGWKELKLASFNPELSTALGFPAEVIHYVLMALTAGVTVAAFEAVGSILVVAMLIVPAAAAQLLTQRLSLMLVIASILSTISAIVGYAGAVHWNTSAAGMMSVVAGLLFFLAVFLAPQTGLFARWYRQWRLALRIHGEDILGALYRQFEKQGQGLSRSHLLEENSSYLRRYALRQLLRQGLLIEDHQLLRLTEQGQARGLQLVRSHRLWELYLHENVALPVDHLHAPAEKIEHYVGPVLMDTLAKDLKQPQTDPHGREIPGTK